MGILRKEIDMKEKRTIRQVKDEISNLTDFYRLVNDKRVRELINTIRFENADKIKNLEAELSELNTNKSQPKPRWPENTPEDVLEECKQYWRGTTEFPIYRIHCWNDKIICTSYPSGGYSDNGGWNPTPATFYFISRTEKGFRGAKNIKTLEGRQSKKKLQQELDRIKQGKY